MVTVLHCIIIEDILKTSDVFFIAIPMPPDTVLSCQPNDHFRETLPDPSRSQGDLPPPLHVSLCICL